MHSEAQTGCPVTYTYTRREARALVERSGFRVKELTVDHVFPYRIRDYVEYRYVKEPYFRWMPRTALPRVRARIRLAPAGHGGGRLAMRVAVVGLGKLGAPLAAVLASKGNEVIGIDVNPDVVRLLQDGRAPVEEPGLQALVRAARERLDGNDRHSTAAAEAERDDPARADPVRRARRLHERVSAATPSRRSGRACIGRDDYHVVVVASTVMPGSCETEIRPALERSSGRRVGETLGLCYSPEFIALGNVIRDMLEPDMVLIGESDTRAGDVLERLYSGMCENDPPFRRMSLVNAELTKIAVNTYVTMKISYANTLADMCERLSGADVETVTDALGLDTPNRGEVPPRRDRLRRALLPARQQGVRRAGPRPRRPRRLLAEATDAVNDAQTEAPRADRPVAPRGRGLRGDSRPLVQARHRSRGGKPRSCTRRDSSPTAASTRSTCTTPWRPTPPSVVSAPTSMRANRHASCSNGPTSW